MTKSVCFIDLEGRTGICTMEGLDNKQIIKIMGNLIIDCDKCSFKKKFEGKEKEHFYYTAWTGDLKIHSNTRV